MKFKLPIVYKQNVSALRLKCDSYPLKHHKAIWCKKSCSQCCTKKIYITIAEAIEIVEHLQAMGLWVDVYKKLQNVDEEWANVDETTYNHLGLECVLLNNRECSVYKVRPLMCATYFVNSHPDLCAPSRNDDPAFSSFYLDDMIEEYHNKVVKNAHPTLLMSHVVWLPRALKYAFMVLDTPIDDYDSLLKRITG